MPKNSNNTGFVYYDKSKKRYFAAVTTPAGQRKKKRFLTKTEAEKWKNAQLTDIDRGAFVEPTNITVGAWAVILAATTGMRIGEVLGLRWCDVLFETSEVYVRQALQNSSEIGLLLETPKTKAGVRKISITNDVLIELKKLKKAALAIDIKQEQLCFVTKSNKPIAPYNFERAWKSIVKRSGVPYRNFHVLRHTHATQLLANGVPIIEVSRRLGHARISHTLELYGHAIPNYDSKIADKVKKLYLIPH